MKIKNFPNFRQSHDYDCGPQALQAVFAYYGFDMRKDEIMKLVETTESGTSIHNMKKLAESHGFATDLRQMTVKDLKKYINKKIPVIILLQAWPLQPITEWENIWDYGHYVVAIGYDRRKVYFEDPETISRTFLTYEELEKRWHDIIGTTKYEHYGLAIYGKKPNYYPDAVVHMD